MLIGLFSLLLSLFSGGSMEVFYIDKIEDGVNKYVSDKDQKKVLKAMLKDYNKAVEEFNKNRKKYLKTLEKQNLDKTTAVEWYTNFFSHPLAERRELQDLFIDQRIKLQQKISQDEWDNIMKMSTDEAIKLEKKEQKKSSKQKSKVFFEKQKDAIVANISDDEKLLLVLHELDAYEKNAKEIQENYDDINTNESDLLADKNATKKELGELANGLNDLRQKMYDNYMQFFLVLKNNTSDDEYEKIIKEFNKVIK